MTISELQKKLTEIKAEHGDIDVVCLTSGCSSSCENEVVTENHLTVRTKDNNYFFETVKKLTGFRGDKYLDISY